jgi:hypothetical protein
VPRDVDGNVNGMDKGLGDTIEKITTITGIKKVVTTVAKIMEIDCGCPERKDMLNKAFPYKQKKNN